MDLLAAAGRQYGPTAVAGIKRTEQVLLYNWNLRLEAAAPCLLLPLGVDAATLLAAAGNQFYS